MVYENFTEVDQTQWNNEPDSDVHGRNKLPTASHTQLEMDSSTRPTTHNPANSFQKETQEIANFHMGLTYILLITVTTIVLIIMLSYVYFYWGRDSRKMDHQREMLQ